LRLPEEPAQEAVLELTDGRRLKLDGNEFAAYLLSARPFSLPCSFGLALVIPERRSRSSGRYWIARGYWEGHRVMAYVGERPNAVSLAAARQVLEQRMTLAASPPPTRTATDSSAIVAALLAQAAALAADGSGERAEIAVELTSLAERLRAV
jgi:hypothetical protein